MRAKPRRTTRFTDTDVAIAASLETVSAPALTAAVAYFTGDPSYLRGSVRPRSFIPNEFQGGLDSGELADLRRRALGAILEYRDAGCPPPPAPDPDLLRETMSWLACEEVEDEYVPMFLEEMNIGDGDTRRIGLQGAGDESRLSALVIGCGQSGLLAGIRLQQAGIPFTILEKNPDVGGTWLDNTYPGCRVDVGNHFYCYSFEPNDAFSEYYSQQAELIGYFRSVMHRWGVQDHVRWRTEVVSARWDDAEKQWTVAVRGPDGDEHLTARILISAVGQLNHPHIPDIPGLESFDGPTFHTAAWDHTVDLGGKRVAMIGAGASGFQVAPTICEQVESLSIFQRTAQWLAPNARYRGSVPDGTKWAMKYLPGYAAWYRFMLLYQSSDRALALVKIAPGWTDLPRSANPLSQARRELLVAWLEQHVGDDPDLLERVLPDYPPMGKRMLQDDGAWLECLRRPNVELVREPILGIGNEQIVTESGEHPADVLILATGFRANEFLYPLEVVGQGGRVLHEVWASAPAAHLGITVPGFPNLFIMYGPGTNLAHAGSIIFHSECQMQFIAWSLRTLEGEGCRSIEVTDAAYEDYVDRLQAALSDTVWAHPSVTHSWYKADDGKVYVLSPWRLVDYWRMTKYPEIEDYVLRS